MSNKVFKKLKVNFEPCHIFRGEGKQVEIVLIEVETDKNRVFYGTNLCRLCFWFSKRTRRS